MAKSNSTSGQDTPSRRVEAAISRLRQTRENGKKVVEKYGKRFDYGSRTKDDEATKAKATKQRNYRKIASGISDKTFEKICNLLRDNEWIWGYTSLLAISRIDNPVHQLAVAEEAIKGKYSQRKVVEICREQRATFFETSPGGRPRDLEPSSEREVLHEVFKVCNIWLRLADQLSKAPDSKSAGPTAGMGVLTRTIAKKFKNTENEMRDLLNSVKRQFKKLQKSEEMPGD